MTAHMKALQIIITRPAPDADALVAPIRTAGADPVLSPVMAIRPRAVEVDLQGIGALAFTSANGVRVFAALSPERGLPVFAVGAATARQAAEAGFIDIETADGDVQSLASLIAASKQSFEILHLAGSDRAGDLIALLAARNRPARRLVIYDAIESPSLSAAAVAALRENAENCAVVFFSPRSLRLFETQMQAAGLASQSLRPIALCFSAAIAREADPSHWRGIEVAEERSVEAMIDLVRQTLAGRIGRAAPAR